MKCEHVSNGVKRAFYDFFSALRSRALREQRIFSEHTWKMCIFVMQFSLWKNRKFNIVIKINFDTLGCEWLFLNGSSMRCNWFRSIVLRRPSCKARWKSCYRVTPQRALAVLRYCIIFNDIQKVDALASNSCTSLLCFPLSLPSSPLSLSLSLSPMENHPVYIHILLKSWTKRRNHKIWFPLIHYRINEKIQERKIPISYFPQTNVKFISLEDFSVL